MARLLFSLALFSAMLLVSLILVPQLAVAEPTVTVTSSVPFSFASGLPRLEVAGEGLGTKTAYCGEYGTLTPSVGKTYDGYVPTNNAKLDWILYHGYRDGGNTDGSKWGLSGDLFEAGTAYAIWFASTSPRNKMDEMLESFSKRDPEIQACARDLFEQASAYEAAGGGGPEQGCSLWLEGSGYQSLVAFRTVTGSLTLHKTSSNPAFSEGNSCYSLAGAVYEVYSDASCSTKVGSLTTREDGSTDTLDGLPQGTYYVREVTPARGFALDVETRGITVIANQTQTLEVSDAPQHNPVRLVLKKLDAETGEAGPLAGATLAGAQFTVRWYAGHYATESDLPQRAARTWTLRTDDHGEALFDSDHIVSGDDLFLDKTGSPTLPLGTIAIWESQTPEGYRPVDGAVTLQQIAGGGEAEVVNRYVVADVPEQVIRGDLRLVKVDGESMARLCGVPFRITSKTTGEHHVAVTDENGHIDTSAQWNHHTLRTNANDRAVLEDGSIDESRLDPRAGIWFSGRVDAATAPNDELGALPFDTYVIEELRCSANEGRALVTFEAVVSRDAVTLDLGTVDDNPPASIGTTLAQEGTGTHDVVTAADVTLVDEVAYVGLVPGRTYTLTGRLMVRPQEDEGSEADGEPDNSGNGDFEGRDEGESSTEGVPIRPEGTPFLDEGGVPVTSVVTFVPVASSGTVPVEFTIDASRLGGSSLVAFERLEVAGELVAMHEDINDEGQTVTFHDDEPPADTPDEPSESQESDDEPEESRKPPHKRPRGNLPQTGDAGRAALWVAGFVGVATLLTGVIVYRRKK